MYDGTLVASHEDGGDVSITLTSTARAIVESVLHDAPAAVERDGVALEKLGGAGELAAAATGWIEDGGYVVVKIAHAGGASTVVLRSAIGSDGGGGGIRRAVERRGRGRVERGRRGAREQRWMWLSRRGASQWRSRGGMGACGVRSARGGAKALGAYPKQSSPRITVTACPPSTTRSPRERDADHAPPGRGLVADQLGLAEPLAPRRGRGSSAPSRSPGPRGPRRGREEPRDEVEPGRRGPARDDHAAHRERAPRPRDVRAERADGRLGRRPRRGSRSGSSRRDRRARRARAARLAGASAARPTGLAGKSSSIHVAPRVGREQAAPGLEPRGRLGGEVALFPEDVRRVASVAWPQRSTSTAGVNQRSSIAVASRHRKAVSERFISRATSCIQRVVAPVREDADRRRVAARTGGR